MVPKVKGEGKVGMSNIRYTVVTEMFSICISVSILLLTLHCSFVQYYHGEQSAQIESVLFLKITCGSTAY